MTTSVWFFLRSAADQLNPYREHHPYGPNNQGDFNTDLSIEIQPDATPNYGRPLAAVDGLIRFIPDGYAETGSLVLQPVRSALEDIERTLGSWGPLVFVYRNLLTSSARAMALPLIERLGDTPFSVVDTVEARAGAFVSGDFALRVGGGDALGTAGPGSGGWARVGLEIVHIMPGLGSPGLGTRAGGESWRRLRELLERTAMTRRLDPVAFYQRLASGQGPALLASGHERHAFLQLLTRRTLIEIRDEYDRPFEGAVTINRGSTRLVAGPPPRGSRGTFVVDLAKGPDRTASEYRVAIEKRVLTLLPSAPAAQAVPVQTLAAPAHWALQAIFMRDVEDPANWFVNNIPPLPRFTANNRVTAIRDGVDTFREYASAMRRVSGASGFIHLAGYEMLDRFRLLYDDPNSTTIDLMRNAAEGDAHVRAVLFTRPFWFANTTAANDINALPRRQGQAILDRIFLIVGSHHQKFMVANDRRKTVGFCGGIDINTDRRDSPHHGALGAMHDVQAMIDGPAVADINRAFADRWNNHPDHRSAVDTAPPPLDPRAGSVFAQVACTYAPRQHYRFAPDGSLTPLRAVMNAIKKAEKFIYIEDQYLTPYPGTHPETAADDTVGVLAALREALPKIDYLIIVIANHTDQPQGRYRRRQFIEGLRAIDRTKVHVFFLGRESWQSEDGEVATEGGCDSCSGGKDHRKEIYVHSKTWIVDDICAKIGSANCNRRGYTHDDEMDLILIDGAVENGVRSFAHRYRVDLWAEHLNLVNNTDLLEDYLQARSFWLNPPQGARIRPYDDSSETGSFHPDLLWDLTIDPDGRAGRCSVTATTRYRQCAGERDEGYSKCTRERDEGYNKCTRERDDGYNRCAKTRDDGYRKCCKWWPCSWACRAWVWVSHIVCVAWTWVKHIVCVAWTWIKHLVCVAWTWIKHLVCVVWTWIQKQVCVSFDFASPAVSWLGSHLPG